MGNIKRASTIVPGGKGFPIVYGKDIQGGLHTVETYEELDNIINTGRSEVGMLVKVLALDKYFEYRPDGTWKEASFGGGEVSSSVLGVIQALQDEVVKLRNSFLYGITSYNDEDTVSSRVVSGLSEADDKEPLWAIDEDDLAASGIECPLNIHHTLTALNGTTIDVSTEGCLGIESAIWEDSQFYKESDYAKQLVYFASSSDEITFHLRATTDEALTLDVPLKDLTYPNAVASYHYMFILSRQYKEIGAQYVYISVSNNETGATIKEGYFNGNTLSEARALLGQDYYIESISFRNLNLTKLNFYMKFQDFSSEIIPSAPKEQDYKYSAAAITIRSVDNKETLDKIKQRLLRNEPVWVESSHNLYINTKEGLYRVGGGSEEENNNISMDTVINALEELGIVQTEDKKLKLNDISSVTFVNAEGKKYTTSVDSEGNLVTKAPQSVYLNTQMNEDGQIIARGIAPASSSTYPLKTGTSALSDNYNRGFVAKTLYKKAASSAKVDGDWKLNADRVKIGAFYTPLATDAVFGCSHAYVELENTSNTDWPLDGCALSFMKPVQNGAAVSTATYTLELEGVIPAGGTFLIRGKKFSDNAYIKVNSYDIEWPLLDTTYDNTLGGGYGFVLYYNTEGVTLSNPFFVVNATDDTTTNTYGKDYVTNPNSYKWYYIDSVGLALDTNSTNYKWFAKANFTVKNNSIYKNVFELDPAKQAFQALTASDSSRVRNDKASDCMTLELTNDHITFPKSFEAYDVRKFTPKASWEHKNVCTDKTSVNKEKPNMVTCSFGINMNTTRCFNWFSAGYANEFVFVKVNGKWERFESYGGGNNDKAGTFSKMAVEAALAPIYYRMQNVFPADGTAYTVHKCIIKLAAAVDSPTTYTYVVGRAGADGNPDLEHCSEEYTFTMYPASYTPRVYQITDQQGFHWIEYQVWAAAALKLNEKIEADCAAEHIVPVLINTGDMTQNGSRINEWLDYYNAGKCLFSHLEQMNCVGNNDLCNVVETNLGTGDDPGKSNPYYFHTFYCYEQPDADKFIIGGKYVPSTYWFGNESYRFLIINSELTFQACANIYGTLEAGTTNKAVNLYTGYTLLSDGDSIQEYKADEKGFTPIYETIYGWLSGDCTALPTLNHKWIVAMHEMPFTVITTANLKTTTKGLYRSANGTSLVGSHTNQLNVYDTKGIYWLSRLMEYFGMDLCIGGHKHTYMCTFPLRENFTWGTHNSRDEQYVMPASLKDDTAVFINGEGAEAINTTKLPYTKAQTIPSGDTSIYPAIKYTGTQNTVTYFMCQATGYKLKSNKELPSINQVFSKVVAGNGLDVGLTSETAQVSQLFPMFGIIRPENHKVQLVRITNLMTIGNKNTESFNQQKINTKVSKLEYLDGSSFTQTTILNNNYEDYTGLKGSSSYWVSEDSADAKNTYIC